MVTPVIRRLSCEDIPAILSIAQDSFPEKWRADEFEFFIAHSASFCHALFLDQKGRDSLAAYFLGLLVQGDLDVITLATASSLRRQGWAHKLLQFVLSQPEVEQGFLEVDSTNTAAIKLYQKLGFEITGLRPRYYQGKKDALLMRKQCGYLE